MLRLPASNANLCVVNTWEVEHAHRIGKEVQRLRKTAKLTAQQLGDRTDRLGLKMTRQAISDLENGRRRYVTTAELIVLAAALGTSPVALVYPGPYRESVKVLPGRSVTEFDAVQWFSAIEWLPALTAADGRTYKHAALDSREDWRTATYGITTWRQIADLKRARLAAMLRSESDDESNGDAERAQREIAMYDKMIRDMRQQLGVDDDA